MHIKEEPLDPDDYENNLSGPGTNVTCVYQSSTNANSRKVVCIFICTC